MEDISAHLVQTDLISSVNLRTKLKHGSYTEIHEFSKDIQMKFKLSIHHS